MIKYCLGIPLAGLLLFGCGSPPSCSPEPTLIPPIVCVRLDTYHDVDRLREEGHSVDYRDGKWFIDEKVAGYAANEDEPTEVCFENAGFR